jgi:hypothetical protein
VPLPEKPGNGIIPESNRAQDAEKMSTPNELPAEKKRFTWREPIAVLITIALVDTTVYHGIGFSGIALLLFVLPLLFLFGVTKPTLNWQTLLFAGLAFLVSLKLIWCGNENVVLLGLGTVFLFAAVQTGVPLHLRNLCIYSVNWLYSAPSNCKDYCQSLRQWRSTGWTIEKAKLAAVFVPLGLLFVFGTIFVFANPDLQEKVQHCWTAFTDWIGRFSDWLPALPQVLLWGVTAWIIIGALRPKSTQWDWNASTSPRTLSPRVPQYDPQTGLYVGMVACETQQNETPPNIAEVIETSNQQEKALFYLAYFNSLVAMIALFCIYLVFEFAKNWTRDFPAGFNYSQHMHQGAAYLTLALALSTIVICTIFRGKTLLDPRIKTLVLLAVIWVGLNFLLAFAVYNRLYIYIDLNGLSMRRIAGLLGTTAVVLGLIMVVRMLLRSEGIRWLLYRYTWSVLAVIFVGFVFPFDWCVSHHNVSRVMKGDLAPSIFLFPPSLNATEHYLASLPLLESDDEIIREGARALFADYYMSVKRERYSEGYQGPGFQWSRSILMNALESRQEKLQMYMDDSTKRQEAIEAFRRHTKRWI